MTSSSTTCTHSRKRAWLAPLVYLLSGGALLGLSTNLAKLAGDIQLPALAFLFLVDFRCGAYFIGSRRLPPKSTAS